MPRAPNAADDPAADAASPADDRQPAFAWPTLAVVLWLAGVLLTALRALGLELRFRRRLARVAASDSPELGALVDQARRAMRVARSVGILETDLVHSPALAGLRRPRVLLPRGLRARLGRAELRAVLLHELAHVRHGDVALNVLLQALACAYWFHPGVWFALRRLRAAQEAKRDWDVLRLDERVDPVRYADIVLDLLEPRGSARQPHTVAFLPRRHELKGRILMIAHFDRTSPDGRIRARILGSSLVLGLGWLTLASAPRADDIPGSPGSPGGAPAAASQAGRIAVERHRPAEPWRAEIEERLARRCALDVTDAPLSEVLRRVGELAGVHLYLDEVTEEELDDDFGRFSLSVADVEAREILDLLRRIVPGSDWNLHHGSVWVGGFHELRRDPELRFYRVQPLLAQSAVDPEEAPDLLIDRVRVFSNPWGTEMWDVEGVALDFWNGLLVVHQTPEGHARVEAFLERLASPDERPHPVERPWLARLENALEGEARLAAEEAPMHAVCASLSAKHGISILADPELAEHEVTARIEGRTLRETLEVLASLAGAQVVPSEGAIFLTAFPPPELCIYAVGDLFDSDDEGMRDHVVDLIRSTVHPASWDEDWRYSIEFWGDRMLVQQGAQEQEQIRLLLDALRRALRE